MKRVVLFLILAATATSVVAGVYTPQSVPNPKRWGQNYYVSNPDGILSSAAVDSLNNLAWALEQASGVEMAIVVLGSFRMTEDQAPNSCELFDFNFELFNLWGIGSAETNRGLLITVSYDDHQMFMSTGTSLDDELPDATCLYIQKTYMHPHFKEGDYDRGVIDGVIAVFGYLTDNRAKEKIDNAVENGDDDPVNTFLTIVIFVGIIFFGLRWARRGGGDDSGGSYSGSSSSWGSSSSSSGGSWGGGSTSGGGAGSRW